MKKHSVVPFEFDGRMVEWNLKHGVITKDQLEKYLKNLEDCSSNAETIEIEESYDSTEQQSH